MLRVLLVCPDRTIGPEVEQQLTQFATVTLVRQLAAYPSAMEMVRLLRAYGPDVVLLSTEQLSGIQDCVSAIEHAAPGLTVATLGRSDDPELLRQLMRLGIREHLEVPVSRQRLVDLIAQWERQRSDRSAAGAATDLLYTFLPAKAGAGASTLAVNSGVLIAERFNKRTLLIDSDFTGGLVGFLLKSNTGFGFPHALERAAELDKEMWPQLVARRGDLDVLHSGPINPSYCVDPQQLRNLLAFCREQYQVICADLSGNMERYSFELMQESKRVFLVTTAEPASLYLAAEKLRTLRALDLDSRVSLVLNRVRRQEALTDEQIAEYVGAPVHFRIPNDYASVHRAIHDGTSVSTRVGLGQCLAGVASYLVNQPMPDEAKKRGLLSQWFFGPAKALGTR